MCVVVTVVIVVGGGGVVDGISYLVLSHFFVCVPPICVCVYYTY